MDLARTASLASSDRRADAEADRVAERALRGGVDSPPHSRAGHPPVHRVVRRMEREIGFDFSRVRIHADGAAEEAASALGARAFTIGRDIGFGAGQFRPDTREGARILAHELVHVAQQARSGRPALQLLRLSHWQHDRAASVSDPEIRTTDEYLAYMNPAHVWQRVDHVTDAEAIQACRFMLAALRNGRAIHWGTDARRYLVRTRSYHSAITTLAADQAAFISSRATAAHVSPGEYVHSVTAAGGYGGGPAPWWDGLTPVEQVAWMGRAASVIARVVHSVRGTPLERLVRARGIVASPRQVEAFSSYAYFSSADNKLHVGRDWIRRADLDPRNVHDNIAHELGGHFEYEGYGRGMAGAIMEGALASMPAAERARAEAGPHSIFSAYAYPETEIFAELREFGRRRPGSGGDTPAVDVPRQLEAIRDRFAPTAAQAIVLELRRRVRATSNISAAAKALLDTSIRTVFPGLLP